ncbi:MAG: hypothetical protein ABI692_16940 [Terracoccus sp.]
MPVVRVYLPVGPVDLAELAERGWLSATPATPATPAPFRVAYAVTPELARRMPGHDVEDLEYAAFSDAVAAAGAARLPAGDPADRRVVIAADVDPEWLSATEPTSEPDAICAVELTEPVPLARVASFHVDERGGSTGDVGAAASVDALLWYDATELDEVRGFLV